MLASYLPDLRDQQALGRHCSCWTAPARLQGTPGISTIVGKVHFSLAAAFHPYELLLATECGKAGLFTVNAAHDVQMQRRLHVFNGWTGSHASNFYQRVPSGPATG